MRSSSQPSLFGLEDAPAAFATVPSLIKWTGTKRGQASRIVRSFPRFGRYFEPFVGSGAVLYAIAERGGVAGDAFEPLIGIWHAVQSSPDEVVAHYRREWTQLQRSLPDHYYVVRERFNRTRDPLDLNFLLRTCVNGIVRFNKSGEFNNSFHLSRRGMEPDRYEQIVAQWSRLIAKVRFACQDYEETVADARKGDLVYLDPPYAGNHQRYSANLDLDRFWSTLERLNSRSVFWALSFDGSRGSADLTHPVPESLYVRRLDLASGHSPVGKVLNSNCTDVVESLYLNYS